MSRRRVAVLGAGIMGSAVAINLARRGFDVTVFDREHAPMAAASRWNEGKIHLGYIYGADPTLATAQHVLTGGLQFEDRLRELVDGDLAGHSTTEDDLYLVHADSVVGPDHLRARFDAISELIREHPDARRYLVDVSDARTIELSPAELAGVAGPDIVAGFRVPERSVETRWVADRLAGAVAAQPGVTLRLGTDVSGVRPLDTADGPWRVLADHGGDDADDDFDLVVNCLWNGRLAIDATAGLSPQPPWTHRFRLCVFLRTRSRAPTAERARRDRPVRRREELQRTGLLRLVVSVGLVAQGSELELEAPPVPTGEAAEEFIARVRGALEPLMPGLGEVFDDAESCVVHGGFVFAVGRGALDDPRSELHRRDRYGAQRLGTYFSVDTGKYSTAPWLARELAERDRRLSVEHTTSTEAAEPTPLVTALVPTYNGSRFISRTLDSLAAQTWPAHRDPHRRRLARPTTPSRWCADSPRPIRTPASSNATPIWVGCATRTISWPAPRAS